MLNEFLSDNYNKLKDLAYNIAGKNSEDLLHLVIEELYYCDEKRINEIIKKKHFIYYIIRVMVNQYNSNTSRYFYKYKKYYKYHVNTTIESISPDNVQKTIEQKKLVEDKLDWIEKKLKDCYWFDAQVFKIYYIENHSLNSMAKATGINRNTIYKSVTNVKKYLKNEQ